MSAEHHCRIARVTDKRTGRSVEFINRPKRNEFSATLVEHAASIADGYPEGCQAFFIVAVGYDGSYNCGHRYDQAKGIIGASLLTALITEIARREIATERQLVDFSVRHGWLHE